MLTAKNQYYLAVAAILFSSAMWGLIWYPMRWLEQAGLSVVWATLVIYSAAALLSSLYLWQKQVRWQDINGELGLLAFVAGVTNIAFLMALIEGSVIRVMLLFYLSPLWSVLIGRWWLGERLSQISILLILLAMSGTVMMLWRPEIGWPWPQGLADWLALLASVSFSFNNVLSRKLAAVSMEMKTTVVFWGVVCVSVVVLLLQQASIPDISATVWSVTFIVGGCMIIAMTVAVLYGLARMPVYRSAIIMLFELVVAAISAWLLTNEHLSSREWLGGLMIIVAAYGIALTEKNLQQDLAV